MHLGFISARGSRGEGVDGVVDFVALAVLETKPLLPAFGRDVAEKCNALKRIGRALVDESDGNGVVGLERAV